MSKDKTKIAAGILFTTGKEILLLKRAKKTDDGHTWSIPGGRAEKDEDPKGAAIRETKEETGLDHIPGYEFGSKLCKGSNQEYTTYLYRVPQKFSVQISDEHCDYAWVPFSKLETYNLHPKFKKSLAEYLKKIRKDITGFSEWFDLTRSIRRTY